MKTSKTKRALAFWLAVAMLASSAPMALAVDEPEASTTDTSNVSVQSPTPASTNEEKDDLTITASAVTMTYGQTDRSVSATVTEGATVSYAVKEGSSDVLEVNSSSGALTAKKAGSGTVVVTAAKEGSKTKTAEVSVTVNKKDVAVSAAEVQKKTYNGKTDATVTSVTFGSDTIDSGDYEAKAVFKSKDVSNSVTADVTVKLTTSGAEKYALTTATVTANAAIEAADFTASSISNQAVEKGTSLETLASTMSNTIEFAGVNGEKVKGTFSSLSATYVSTIPKTRNGEAQKSFATDPGRYTVSGKFVATTANYKTEEKEISFTCDVEGDSTRTLTFSPDKVTATYGGDVTKPTLTGGVTEGIKTYTSSKTNVATVNEISGDVTIKGVGTTTITVNIAGTDDYEKTSASYDLTVNPKTLTSDAVTLQTTSYTYDGNAKTPTVEVKDSQATLVNGTDYTVAYSDNTNAGTAKVTVTLKGNYTGTLTKNFTINKINHPSYSVAQSYTQEIGTSTSNQVVTLAIPTDMTKLDGYDKSALTEVADTNNILSDMKFSGDSVQVTVSKNATSGQSGKISFKVTTTNYNDITVTYEVKVTGKKTLSSSDIVFESKSVTYDGKTQQLTAAQHKSNSPAKNEPGKWTYAVTNTKTRAVVNNESVPTFVEPGEYTVVATWNGTNYTGSKTATLTIKSANVLSFSVSKNNDKDNDNYSDYKYTTVEKNGYFKIEAEGKDDLTSFTIDGSKEYWIGFDITPKLGTSTFDAKNLYYRTSSSGSWKALTDGTYGDFYIDVGSTDMTVWLDTRNDKDNKESIYLATNSSGANEVELIVDFDSYSGDDDDDKSSSGTSTKKVDGDKVTTTKVNKSPSVKSKTASVSFSSSAITDAIDDVKKGYKDDKADKKVIHLDVDTSKSCDETIVTIPTKSVDKIADADASLKLETKQGTFTIDEDALANLADDASGSDIDFCIEEIDDDEFRLYAKSSKKYLTDLGKGEAEIVLSYTLKKNEKAADVRVYRIGDAEDTYLAAPADAVYGALNVMGAVVSGTVTEMKDAEYKSKKVTFTADDLGTFRITTDVLTTGTTTNPNPPTTSSTFYDVPMSRWSAPYIYKLANAGIVSGTGGNQFQPTLYVTREEFVKMLAGVAGANVSAYNSSKFSDVPSSRWSAPYVAWAASLGVTNGDTATTFAPTKYITRQEMAAMIYRYVQISGKTLPTRNTAKRFTDASLISSWASAAVSTMQQAGIIDGNALSTGGYAFEPLTSASREECAKMLAVLYDLI